LVDQGFLFLNDGKFEESLSQFDKAITLIPTNPYNVPRKLDHQNAKVRYNLTNQWGSK
jgi:hypothetical protein